MNRIAPTPAFGLALAAALGGCDPSVVTVEDSARLKVDRRTSLVELELVTTATADAVLDVTPTPSDNGSPWDERPSSLLEVRISAESRGVLGLGIVETDIFVWVEDADGQLVSSSDTWPIGGEPTSGVVFMDDVLRTCDDVLCRDRYSVVVAFSDEDARVKLRADATLRVDYDFEVGSAPMVAMSLAAR